MLKEYFDELHIDCKNDEERIEFLIQNHREQRHIARKYYELLSQLDNSFLGRRILKKLNYVDENKNKIGYTDSYIYIK